MKDVLGAPYIMFETSCGLGTKLYTEKLVLITYRGHDGVAMAGGGVELQMIHRLVVTIPKKAPNSAFAFKTLFTIKMPMQRS